MTVKAFASTSDAAPSRTATRTKTHFRCTRASSNGTGTRSSVAECKAVAKSFHCAQLLTLSRKPPASSAAAAYKPSLCVPIAAGSFKRSHTRRKACKHISMVPLCNRPSRNSCSSMMSTVHGPALTLIPHSPYPTTPLPFGFDLSNFQCKSGGIKHPSTSCTRSI